MAPSPDSPAPKYFNVSSPSEYVTHVEINRPEKLNAFLEPMWKELRAIFDSLSESPSVRAVVLSGAGPKAFTAGLDVQPQSKADGVLGQFDNFVDPARGATFLRRHVLDFQDCISAIERCEKPVICVMHGYTFGLGIDIAVCADVRICSSDVQFCVKEVDIGLAADIGTLSRLPKVVGSYSWAKDVALSARVFGAEEAEKVGFVSGVSPGKQAAVEEGIRWATMVANKSPVAVQGTKELMNWSRDHPVADGLRYTGVWNSAFLQTNDVGAALQGTLQKKKPKFEKL